MPPRKPEAGANQDVLMAVSPGVDHVSVRDFNEDSSSVSLIDHHLQQLNALSLFGAINQREGFIKQREGAEARYGERAAAALEGAKQNRDALEAQARDEFYRSIGLFAVEETVEMIPGTNIAEYRSDAQRRWNIFQARYRGAHHVLERNAYGRRLRDEITMLQSQHNRTEGIRPHMPDKERAEQPGHHQLPPKLPTRERLQAIHEDPRAGFLPTTNEEKNTVLAWLDYLDNPKYPLGVNNQLLEIYNKHQRNSKNPAHREHAKRAMLSIPHEVYDFWSNATESLENLTDLSEILSLGQSPKVSLTEEVQAHPAFGALIRYRDLARFRDKNQLPSGIKNPLMTREDRRPHLLKGKNKTLEDIYTQKELTPDVAEYIEQEAAALTIGQARSLLRKAIVDQKARQTFAADRLMDFAGAPDYRQLGMRNLARFLLRRSNIRAA